jgi:hypothetical protein
MAVFAHPDRGQSIAKVVTPKKKSDEQPPLITLYFKWYTEYKLYSIVAHAVVKEGVLVRIERSEW